MKLDNTEDFMLALERGQAAVDFMTEVRETLGKLQTLAAHGGEHKGSVTLKIAFAMKSDTFSALISIDAKTPKPKRKTTTLWVDDDGNPCTSDPRQQTFFERSRETPMRARAPATIDQ